MFMGLGVESKEAHIKIECRGKIYEKSNSSNWSSEVNRTSEVVKIYTLSNSPDSKGKDYWYFDSGFSVYTNANSNVPNQPGNPYWYRNIFVTYDEISIVISGGNDFDNNKKNDDSSNQKHEYRREIRINRISGDWTEKSKRKTAWRDGGWLTDDDNTYGKCQKGTQRF